MLLTSIVSCCHVASVAILLGSHVAGPDNRGSGGIMGGNNLGMGALATQLTNFLRHTSQRHGSNSFVYGALFGATVLMTLVMHILSVYFGHLVACVKFNVSANDSTASNVVKHTGFHLFSQCGASGAVGFVSFLTGLLVWLNFSLAIVLYAGREALMSDAHSHQYDEIGSDNINRNGGFDGDFPLNGVSGMRTMQV